MIRKTLLSTPAIMNTSNKSTDALASRLDKENQSRHDATVIWSYGIAMWKNTLVATLNWLLLASFVVFPSTFASLSRAGVLGSL